MGRTRDQRNGAKSVSASLKRARRFYEAGRYEEATELCKRIVAQDPQNTESLVLLGGMARIGRQFLWAERFLNTALTIDPGKITARLELCESLRLKGDLAAAETCFRAALSRGQEKAVVENGLGTVLANQGRHREAVSAFERALKLMPENHQLYSNLLMALQYDPQASDEQRFAVACRYGRLVERSLNAKGIRYANNRNPDRTLNIGYVSPDLGRHPVGVFLSAFFAEYDRNSSKLYCYSGRANEDEITARLKKDAHAWRSTIGMSDRDLVRRICADKIDVLVDLSGHCGAHRLGVFALRPAPVQMSWIGYPETTGLSAIDYVLSDAATAPPGSERWFVEEVLRLPRGRFCYSPPAYAPAVAQPPCLTNGFITFGSFNNLSKVTGEVLDTWSELLRLLPDARLLLKWKSLDAPWERDRIRREFKERLVAPERLELRGADPHEEMLVQYGDIDIVLDPFPFSGGLTSCEALWQGVPVITLPQERPASRQTFSFLRALGLADLGAHSASDYVRLARELALDRDRMAILRATMRARMAASALCDATGHSRDIEAVYRTAWRRWCSAA